jgi:hypothetical protein
MAMIFEESVSFCGFHTFTKRGAETRMQMVTSTALTMLKVAHRGYSETLLKVR